MKPTTNALDYALRFAALGWYVFPIRKYQKKGYHVESWDRDASNDPDQIKQWYDEHECNFGLHCGKSRVGVLDIDDRGQGVANLGFYNLDLEIGPIPLVVVVNTPHKGRQIYFSDLSRNKFSGEGCAVFR